MTSSTDSLYASPIGNVAGFQFDKKVVDVFPDMLVRSIPGYQNIIAQTGLLAHRYVQPNSNVYDLGCSLGSTLFAIAQAIPETPCHLIGIDSSAAMIDRCKELLELNQLDEHAKKPNQQVSLICEDLCNTKIQHASVVALNFTLQFIDPKFRNTIIENIYQGMTSDGAFIISEKVAFDDPELQQLYIDRYHAFKIANGYSELEISQKRTALERVLIPETIQSHKTRLKSAGFRHCAVWFQCFNFMSMIALK